MAEYTVDLPPGYGIPTVDLATDLLPAPTVAAMQAGLVVFRNFDGTQVLAPKVVAITLTADGMDIDNIAVYDSIEDVG
jgi:hypothetical protein